MLVVDVWKMRLEIVEWCLASDLRACERNLVIYLRLFVVQKDVTYSNNLTFPVLKEVVFVERVIIIRF